MKNEFFSTAKQVFKEKIEIIVDSKEGHAPDSEPSHSREPSVEDVVEQAITAGTESDLSPSSNTSAASSDLHLLGNQDTELSIKTDDGAKEPTECRVPSVDGKGVVVDKSVSLSIGDHLATSSNTSAASSDQDTELSIKTDDGAKEPTECRAPLEQATAAVTESDPSPDQLAVDETIQTCRRVTQKRDVFNDRSTSTSITRNVYEPYYVCGSFPSCPKTPPVFEFGENSIVCAQCRRSVHEDTCVESQDGRLLCRHCSTQGRKL
jgi:hypothetical protein